MLNNTVFGIGNERDVWRVLHFASKCLRVAYILVAMCIFLCVIWAVYLSIRICSSLCRKVKPLVERNEVNIIKKARLLIEQTQNKLLLLACIAIKLSMLFLVFGFYEIGRGLSSLLHDPSRINCRSITSDNNNVLFSKLIFNGYSLVFACCFIGALHILISLYIKVYNSTSIKNQVKSQTTILFILMCVGLLGVTITCSTFYTSVAVWLCICIQSVFLCYKAYKFNRLLLKHQEDAIDLYQNIRLRNEIRDKRYEFSFLAIPICGVSILSIFLFACTIALSSFYVTLAECSHMYNIFNTIVIRHISPLQQVFTILILEYAISTIAATVALLIIFTVGIYTFYYVIKRMCRSPQPKESTVPEEITRPLLYNHHLP